MHKRLIVMGQLLGLALGALAVLALLALGFGPRLVGYRTVTVLTASMRPSMPEGSLIVQTPVPLQRVGVGDVITYRIPVDDRRVVTHRVVEVVVAGARPVVRTKGDANAGPDPWVARLEGTHTWKVRFAVPKAGYAVQALRHPLARRLTMLVVPALLAVVWLRDIWAPRADRHPPRPVRAGAAQVSPTAGSRRWRYAVAVGALVAVALVANHPRRRFVRRARWGNVG